jgi:methionyl-tRNA formyltransferase
MRILMMGTGPFAVPTFRALLASDHTVLALVTRPAVAAPGRSSAVVSSGPMRDVAEAAGLPVYAPESINDPLVIAELTAIGADLCVVCDYGQILSPGALAIAKLGGINLHASLLPRYRGAAPIHWALYHGETTTGVSVIQMTPGLDAGPCLVQIPMAIAADEDAVALEHRLAQLGVEAVLQAIALLAGCDQRASLGIDQDRTQASKARRLRKTDGRVDWTRTARQIFDQVRAFKPWPGSYTEWQRTKGPQRLLLERVTVVDMDRPNADSGTVVQVTPQRVIVACGQGHLGLEVIQPAGKKPLETAAFLRGYPLRPGDRLG